MFAEQGNRVRGAGDPPGRRAAGTARAPHQRAGRPPQRRRVAQYTSARFARALLLAGLTPSVGTVGDALDNALAETTIGLYKTECTRAGSPFRHGPIRSLADLEAITSAWVHWYNTARLMHRLGRGSPAEAGPHTTSRQRTPRERGPGENKEKGGGFAAAHRPARRAGYRAAPPASRVLRIALARDSPGGLPWTPETSAALGSRKSGQAQGLPGQARGRQSPSWRALPARLVRYARARARVL